MKQRSYGAVEIAEFHAAIFCLSARFHLGLWGKTHHQPFTRPRRRHSSQINHLVKGTESATYRLFRIKLQIPLSAVCRLHYSRCSVGGWCDQSCTVDVR